MSNRRDFPNLPFIYNKDDSRRSRGRSGHNEQADGVTAFFNNLISHVNKKKRQDNIGALPTLRMSASSANERYDPTAPLLTSDIYVAKPSRFKSSVETDVERIKGHLSRMSTLYKEVMEYKKPKIIPLLPIPDHHRKKRLHNNLKAQQPVDEIPEDQLLQWNFSNNVITNASKPKLGATTTSIKSKKSDKDAGQKTFDPEKARRGREKVREAFVYVTYCIYLFRLFRYQISKCHSIISSFMKENYTRVLTEISNATFKLVKPQIIRMWLAIFCENNLTIIINKNILLIYGLIDEKEARNQDTPAQVQEYIQGLQPYADEIHVASR